MKKATISLIGILLILGFSITFFYSFYKKDLPKYGEPGHKISSFSFINQNGKVVTDKDVANKVRVIEYFFTTCKGICPKMNRNMLTVYKQFKGDPNVVILSHTVNPEVDSVPVLKKYSDSIGVLSQQWMFLTGDKKELYDVARAQYLLTAGEFNDTNTPIEQDFIHTEKFALVDKNDQIRGFYDGTNEKEIEKLISDIKQIN